MDRRLKLSTAAYTSDIHQWVISQCLEGGEEKLQWGAILTSICSNLKEFIQQFEQIVKDKDKNTTHKQIQKHAGGYWADLWPSGPEPV